MVFSREMVEKLLEFHSKDYYVLSLYLNVNGRYLPRKKHIEQEWDFLLHQAKKEIPLLPDLSKQAKTSLDSDLEEITHFVNYEFERDGFRTLVVFSCSGEKFWETYPLPVALRSHYVLEKKPYVRPLLLVLDEHQRYATAVVDRRKARIFTVFLGQIEEHTGVFEDDVPAKVKAGEWANLRETKISHHIEDHVHRHLKHVAEKTLEFFKEREFDRLIVAGHEEIAPKFEALLHPYLQERMAGRFYVEPDVSLDEILKQSLVVEERRQRQDEAELLKKLYDLAKPEGRAVVGLEATIEALMLGQVQKLLVGGEYKASGLICPEGHLISSYARECPVCGAGMKEEKEIIADIIEETVKKDGEVEYIFWDEKFIKEGIGAFLRYTV
jgi:peptide chain release factor subunit 1